MCLRLAVFPLWVSLPFSFYKDTGHVGLGRTLMIPMWLCLQRLLPNKVMVTGPNKGYDFNLSLGGHDSTHSRSFVWSGCYNTDFLGDILSPPTSFPHKGESILHISVDNTGESEPLLQVLSAKLHLIKWSASLFLSRKTEITDATFPCSHCLRAESQRSDVWRTF